MATIVNKRPFQYCCYHSNAASFLFHRLLVQSLLKAVVDRQKNSRTFIKLKWVNDVGEEEGFFTLYFLHQ